MALSNFHKTLLNISEKLGIDDVPLQKKGEEFLITYNNKASLKNLNDNAIAVLCLDLAATHLGVGFDSENAVKTSGLKKSVYKNTLHNIEKILNLDKPLTISDLCVQFSCTVVKEVAGSILENYVQQHNIDSSHPQYAAVSVFTACKLKKFKVQRSHFVTISRLKPSQWKELEADFEKFASGLGLVANRGRGRPKKESNQESNFVEEFAKTKEAENSGLVKKNIKEENKVEEYEVWKKRILDEAKAALGLNSD